MKHHSATHMIKTLWWNKAKGSMAIWSQNTRIDLQWARPKTQTESGTDHLKQIEEPSFMIWNFISSINVTNLTFNLIQIFCLVWQLSSRTIVRLLPWPFNVTGLRLPNTRLVTFISYQDQTVSTHHESEPGGIQPEQHLYMWRAYPGIGMTIKIKDHTQN